MTKEILKSHYERKYSQDGTVSSIEQINMVKIPISRFEAVVKFFPQYFHGGNILELGAGNGNVAKTLLASKMGIENYTIGELSSARVDGIRRDLDDPRLKVLEMDAEAIPENESGKYDAVIMIALIEHLIDPLGAMQRIKQLLKPGGFVYIDTPNIARYTFRLKLLFGRFPSTASKNEGLTTFSGDPSDLYDEGHLHYFTFRSLSLMLTQRCGFSRVIKLAYPLGPKPFGKHIHNYLAKIRPELFSELAIIAYR
jgi:2-polyprenyl-3-methyl-5-hydroxy-6-metoxy-1,4-benzoquinol methylase